jgi:hypothetical protein
MLSAKTREHSTQYTTAMSRNISAKSSGAYGPTVPAVYRITKEDSGQAFAVSITYRKSLFGISGFQADILSPKKPRKL